MYLGQDLFSYWVVASVRLEVAAIFVHKTITQHRGARSRACDQRSVFPGKGQRNWLLRVFLPNILHGLLSVNVA